MSQRNLRPEGRKRSDPREQQQGRSKSDGSILTSSGTSSGGRDGSSSNIFISPKLSERNLLSKLGGRAGEKTRKDSRRNLVGNALDRALNSDSDLNYDDYDGSSSGHLDEGSSNSFTIVSMSDTDAAAIGTKSPTGSSSSSKKKKIRKTSPKPPKSKQTVKKLADDKDGKEKKKNSRSSYKTYSKIVKKNLAKIQKANVKSQWDEVVEVLQEVLCPTSEAYGVLTKRQRKGLQMAQDLLLNAQQGSGGGKRGHIPCDLLVNFEKKDAGLLGRDESRFLLKEYGGVLSSRRTSIVNGSNNDTTTTTTAIDNKMMVMSPRTMQRKKKQEEVKVDVQKQQMLLDMFAQSLSNAVAKGPNFSHEFSRFMERLDGNTETGRFGSQQQYFVPPEFCQFSISQQTTLCNLLAWETLDSWNYNIFQLNQLCLDSNVEHPLLFMGWAILASPQSQYSMKALIEANHMENGEEKVEKDVAHEQQQQQQLGYDFLNQLQIPEETLCNYLRVIESDYKTTNPYHNQIHAADVVQTLHAMIQMKYKYEKPELVHITIKQQQQREEEEDDKPQPTQDSDSSLFSTSSTSSEPSTTTKPPPPPPQQQAKPKYDWTPLELFSILLAACVHDVGHPGMNNAFQINRKTDLALQYNDLSVLENFHASRAFFRMFQNVTDTDDNDAVEKKEAEQSSSNNRSLSKLPPIPKIDDPDAYSFGNKTPDLNVLQNLSNAEVSSIRKNCIEAVLHTDMSKHFASVTAMKGLVISTTAKANDDESSCNDNDKDNDTPAAAAAAAVELKDGEPWKILCYMLHLADISNPAKAHPMFELWTDRCLEEFFQQGDQEAMLKLPVSLNCDRSTTNRAGSQIGFITFVIHPAYEVLSKLAPGIDQVVMPIIQDNLAYWSGIREEEKEKKEQQTQSETPPEATKGASASDDGGKAEAKKSGIDTTESPTTNEETKKVSLSPNPSTGSRRSSILKQESIDSPNAGEDGKSPSGRKRQSKRVSLIVPPELLEKDKGESSSFSDRMRLSRDDSARSVGSTSSLRPISPGLSKFIMQVKSRDEDAGFNIVNAHNKMSIPDLEADDKT